jgi:hypothetical protein
MWGKTSTPSRKSGGEGKGSKWCPFGKQSHRTYTLQVIASLILLYFACLPHPVVPLKFYFTVLRIGVLSHARSSAVQLRLLIHMLPPVCRNIIVRLSSWLYGSKLPPEMLAKLFVRYMLRPTNAPNSVNASVPQAAIRAVQCMIEQAEFISMAADEPVLTSTEAAQAEPIPGSADYFRLEALASYANKGGEGQVCFEVGDRIQLIDVYPDNWL